MPRVGPFRGLRFNEAVAGPLASLTAPPYDVISAPHRDSYLASSRFNVVHLDLAEGGEDAAEPGNRYERAAALLEEWRAAGALTLDDEPRYYAYELDWPEADGHGRGTIRGVFCALTLEPWGGAVVPHEQTMPGPVADRLELLRATRTHLSPIYGTVAGPSRALAVALDATRKTEPIGALRDEEGVRHRLWPLDGDLPIGAWLADEELLIADGHHRYTTALAYRDERHRADGPGPWDEILTFVVDAGTQTVPVLPYHRVQLFGAVPASERAVSDLAELESSVRDDTPTIGTIVRHDDAVAFGILELHGDPPAVRALHEEVLDRHAPGDALRFTHSAPDALAAVRSGDAIAAYVLPPTTPERVRAAIHHGDRLPRKSTFFWPKPRTGMVFMPVDLRSRSLP